MIITYPTGFYANVLPRLPSDVGNVTYTISDSAPPRADLLFPMISPGAILRRQPVRTLNPVLRRAALGQLVFSTSSSQRSATGSNAEQYEIGQILEFNIVPTITAQPLLAGSGITIQHDVGLLDYGALGISQDQVGALGDLTTLTYQKVQGQLESLRQASLDTQVQIAENQKTINENQKAASALTVLPDSQLVASIISQLSAQLDALQQSKIALILQSDSLASQTAALQAQLRQLAQLVR